jgi:hypothetical protein
MHKIIPLVDKVVDKVVDVVGKILLVLLGFVAAVVVVLVEVPVVFRLLVVAVVKVKPESNTQLLLAQLKP